MVTGKRLHGNQRKLEGAAQRDPRILPKSVTYTDAFAIVGAKLGIHASLEQVMNAMNESGSTFR